MRLLFTREGTPLSAYEQSKTNAVRLLSLVCLVFAVASCTTNYRQGGVARDQSPKFEYIQEYAFSPDSSMLALIVPVGDYNPRMGGMEKSQIVVLDTENLDALYSSEEYTELAPRNLQWSPMTEQLSFMAGGNLISWELKTGLSTSAPFYHTGFALSYAGDRIVTWGQLREAGTGLVEVLTGRLETYSLPNFEKGESILVERAFDVLDVAWATDDSSVIALVRTLDDSKQEIRSIYKIDLSTREQKLVLEGVPVTSDFAWNSTNDLIAFTRNNTLSLYDVERDCYVYETQYSASRLLNPAWRNSGLTIAFIKDDVSVSQVVALDFDSASLPHLYDCLK